MTMMKIRVKELRNIRAGNIRPHPNNWRTHPREQVKAFEALVDEIGFSDVLIAYEASDGHLTLIDGHMRAGLHPDEELPVVILDVNDDEADALLASIDPISEMAKTNREKLDIVLGNMTEEMRERLKDLPHSKPAPPQKHKGSPSRNPITCPECGAEI